MKKFLLSKREQLSKNIFAFIRNDKMILFNRFNFRRIYIENKISYKQLNGIVREMDKKTLERKFSFPTLRKIRIEITMKCNCRCDYCLVFQNDLQQVGPSMNENIAQKIINFYHKGIKNGSLMITGGEPFLNWPIVKLFVEQIQDPIQIFTNGTIINGDILNTLKKHQNVRLFISLDGKQEDNQKRKFQNGREIYSMVLKNIKTLQRKGIKLAITCLATNENVSRLYEIIKFFVNDLNVKYLGVSFPHYISRDYVKKIDLEMEKYIQEMIKIFEFAINNKVYVDQLAKRFSPLITEKFRFYACKLLGEQITFYPDGNKTLCTKIDSLNDFKKYDLEYFKNVIPINNKFCQNCPAIGICGGGCFWDGIMRFKNGIDERECILNNTLLDYFLWNIFSIEKIKIPLEERFGFLLIK